MANSRYDNSIIPELLKEWERIPDQDRPDKETQIVSKLNAQLASLPSQHLLTLIYGKNSPIAQHPLIVDLRSTYPRRRQLLQVIYGEAWRAIESTYIRLPSEEKRQFVANVVAKMKRRDKWFTSKILHAYAFKPTSFVNWYDQNGQNTPTPPKSMKRGSSPLYQRVEITRRPGNPRILYVPTPPLMRLQREILTSCLDPAVQQLSPCVMGCRKNTDTQNYGIFANASAHIGQEYVAKFDIQDFFPSVRFSDIVETLSRLTTPITLKRDHEGKVVSTKWTHDLAVLVGRLCTRFGRLPQGAPTSPAIANLVFSRIDREIQAKLGSNVIFTRYVDDLTFSLSKNAATKLGIKNAEDFRSMIQPHLENALSSTSFKVNAKKTRVTKLKSGHKITGLSVGKEKVNLTLGTRRRLRALQNNIRKNGFVSAAEHWTCAERLVEILNWTLPTLNEIQSAPTNTFSKTFVAKFLISICPNLKVEIPQETFAIGNKRVIRDHQLHEGNAAAHDCLLILSSIWAGKVAVELDGPVVELQRVVDQRVIARIRAERNIELLQLSRRQFHATFNLWQHLRGWYAGLHTPRNDNCFTQIEKVRRDIAQTFDTIRIRTSDQSSNHYPINELQATIAPSLSLHANVTELSKAAHEIFQRLYSISELFSDDRRPNFRDVAKNLEFPADTRELFVEWLTKLAGYIDLTLCPESCNVSSAIYNLKFLIRIFRERLLGERYPVYDCEKDLLKLSLGKQVNLNDLARDNYNRIQLHFLGRMKDVLTRLYNLLKDSSIDLREIAPPIPPIPIGEKLKTAFDRFISLHQSAVWKKTQEKMFTRQATDNLQHQRLNFLSEFSTVNSTETWNNVGSFAVEIIKNTTEGFHFTQTLFSERVSLYLTKMNSELNDKNAYHQLYDEIGDKQELFKVLFKLRNRAVHGKCKSEEKLWQDIDRYCADLLKKHLDNKSPARLELTALEGRELKLLLLDELAAAMEAVQPSKQ